jgi:hypothetical protein
MRRVVTGDIEPSTLDALRSWCQREHLTLGTLFNGAWALVLGATLETGDVVFGATMSGRWGEVEGIDRITGPTMGSVPCRVRLPAADLGAWLRSVQAQLATLQRHVDVAWDRIERVLGLAPRSLLTWSNIVIENMPDELWRRPYADLILDDFHHHTSMPQPLMVSVFPVPHWYIKITVDTGFVSEVFATELLRALFAVLSTIAAGNVDVAALRSLPVQRIRG